MPSQCTFSTTLALPRRRPSSPPMHPRCAQPSSHDRGLQATTEPPFDPGPSCPHPPSPSCAPQVAAAEPDGPLVLRRLAASFGALRDMHTGGGGGGGGGSLQYPYSMREAVAVARHMETFPGDGVVEALENVLAFDTFTPETRAAVARVFQSQVGARGVPRLPGPCRGAHTTSSTTRERERTKGLL